MNPSIIVVGCGGTGSFVAEGLCRLLPKEVPLILVDHDRVETRNLIRQNFYSGDVGKFKSQALAENLALRYDRKVGYSVYPFDPDTEGEAFGGFKRKAIHGLIIGCVDNAAARREIARSLYYGNWWLDSGNGDYSGQVVIGNVTSSDDLAGGFHEKSPIVDKLPAPSLQIPSLLIPAEKPRGERNDCAGAVERDEQSPLINQLMATLVLEFVNRLINDHLTWMGVYVDLENGTMRPVPADPQTVARMCSVKIKTLLKREEEDAYC